MTDADHIRAAIAIAQTGRGAVEPNPMVGCVLVRDGRVIGAGRNDRYGGPHAEPTALAECAARGESAAGATAYVTLEPCCHTNKQTPPCAPRLVAARVSRVVYGCLDPNPDVNGNGVAMLRAAGVVVDGPVLEAEARQLIAPFLARVNGRRPYVTLKWAQTADGKVAGPDGRPVRITSAASDREVHALRGRCDAIAIGTNTALNDDPLLTARGVSAARPLLRVVLSNAVALPPAGRLARSAREHPVVLFCSESSAAAHADRVAALAAAGVEVVPLPDVGGRFAFDDVLRHLRARDVMHLLVEPGPTLAASLLARGQADRVWVFRSPSRAGDDTAPAAAPFDYPSTGTTSIDGDTLTEFLDPTSNTFFAMTPSADFLLASARQPVPS